MLEIPIEWTTRSGQHLSICYFDSDSAPGVSRTALAEFLRDFAILLSGSTTWTIATEGREMNPATGLTTGFWAQTEVLTGTGGGGEPVADATQVLMRWRTDGVVNGRRVQGRTFIPGIASSTLLNGNLNPANAGTIQAAAESNLLGAAAGFIVWSRPTDTRAGSEHPVTSAAVWAEFAVQRRRRG